MKLPCADGLPNAKGELCPYHEHEPQTETGWIVLQLTELCLTSTGMAVSIDIPAAMRAGEELGADMLDLVELLPEAQGGVLTGLAKKRERDA